MSRFCRLIKAFLMANQSFNTLTEYAKNAVGQMKTPVKPTPKNRPQFDVG